MSEVWRRFAKHRLAVIGLGVILALVVLALGARQIAPHDPIRQDLPHALAKPSVEFPLGTDEFGRCILSRILYGARLSLLVGVIATGIGASAGILSGLLAGLPLFTVLTGDASLRRRPMLRVRAAVSRLPFPSSVARAWSSICLSCAGVLTSCGRRTRGRRNRGFRTAGE